jgi:L-2-hydroxyglutarate oxidase LhgO
MMVPSRDGYRFRTLRYRDIVDTATWPGTWKVVKRFWRTGLIEIRMAASKRAYVRAAAEYVPSLDVGDLDGTFHSGVRAQAVGADGTLLDDFDISQVGRITHVRNAPSPAATSAFALARELVDRIDGR